MKSFGYAAQDSKSSLAPYHFERREAQAKDLVVDILFCGVCHSDLHQIKDEWEGSIYPMVPGHEIVGRVSEVGSKVSRFSVGDLVGVGCMVDSCRSCSPCKESLEQYCETGFVATYNSREYSTGKPTFGGYSSNIVVDEAFALKIPRHLDLARTAPLLCAGITTYSPLKHWKVGKNQKVGIIGLGGLGHMGVKFARAFGAHVTVFTSSPGKCEDALRLGAHEVVMSKDLNAMKQEANKFHFLLDTVAAPHDLNQYIGLLRRDGSLVMVGIPDKPFELAPFKMIFGRRQVGGSLIGGIQETQEMLDFCGTHEIQSDIELIPIQSINEAYGKMLKGEVKYRFVIDMKSLID